MALRKVQSGVIADNAITTDKIAAGAVTASDIAAGAVTPPTPTAVSDQVNTSTGYFDVPAGTTAQRPVSPNVGMIRYNTTLGFLEQYTEDGWQGIAPPPAITTVSPTTYNGEQGTSFTINGSNFDATVTAKFITNNGTEYTAASVSRISSSQLVITTPQDFTVAQEPLDVKVINGSGLATTIENIIDCGGTPTWSTSAGTLATYYYPSNTSYSISISATDPDSSATVSYSVTSGSLPSGASLNSSTGSISGNIGNPNASSVTTNFDVTATDNAGNSTVRSFNIIRKWQDGSSSEQYATSAAAIKSLTGTTTNGVYWVKASSSAPLQQVYCIMDTAFAGGGWMIISNNDASQIMANRPVQARPTAYSSYVGTTSSNSYSTTGTWNINAQDMNFTEMVFVAYSSTFTNVSGYGATSFNTAKTIPTTSTWYYYPDSGGHLLSGLGNKRYWTSTAGQYGIGLIGTVNAMFGGSGGSFYPHFGFCYGTSGGYISFTGQTTDTSGIYQGYGVDDWQDGEGLSDMWGTENGGTNATRGSAAYVMIK